MARTTRKKILGCRTTNLDDLFSPGRRRFLKKAGMIALATSSYSLVSMTQFGCSDDDNPINSGGTNYYYSDDYYDDYGYPWRSDHR